MHKLVVILGIVFVVLLFAYVGISIYIASVLTQPIASPLTEKPDAISSEFEDISFTARDGINLKGWLFKNTSENLIIFVNGTNMNRTDSGYGVMQIASELYQKGYSILLFDRRTTGESEGDRILFGLPERFDVIASVDFAKSKGFEAKRIGIIANSLGAVSTLMGIEELKDVGPIVLDSCAANIKDVVAHIMRDERGIPEILHPGVFLAGFVLYGIDLGAIRPVDKLALVPERKFLFLHSRSDKVILYENSVELLKKTNKESRLVTFEGADHVQTYKTNPEVYRAEVFSFLDSELSLAPTNHTSD